MKLVMNNGALGQQADARAARADKPRAIVRVYRHVRATVVVVYCPMSYGPIVLSVASYYCSMYVCTVSCKCHVVMWSCVCTSPKLSPLQYEVLLVGPYPIYM